MNIIPTSIPDLVLIEPRVFNDRRGYFLESFSQETYAQLGINLPFVQDNESCSELGAIRGLHFQAPPFEQGKLVRVIKGAVLDVAVDIRVGSPTYGQHVAVELNDRNKRIFWVPPGFAHGFQTLEQDTVFVYKCTGYYNKASEGGLMWNDQDLQVQWLPVDEPIISDKDQILSSFKDFQSPFVYNK
jgi:dTDP-4-dehydrorhamnose 3,5-epimerase